MFVSQLIDFVIPLPGKPVMIVIEYMENGSLDAFLRVSTVHSQIWYVYGCMFLDYSSHLSVVEGARESRWSAVGLVYPMNAHASAALVP